MDWDTILNWAAWIATILAIVALIGLIIALLRTPAWNRQKSGWLATFLILGGLAAALWIVDAQDVRQARERADTGLTDILEDEKTPENGNLVTIPEIRPGANAADVEQALKSRGLNVSGLTEPSDTVQRGRVIRTDPPGNTRVRRGDWVTVYISEGPPPQPTQQAAQPTPRPTEAAQPPAAYTPTPRPDTGAAPPTGVDPGDDPAGVPATYKIVTGDILGEPNTCRYIVSAPNQPLPKFKARGVVSGEQTFTATAATYSGALQQILKTAYGGKTCSPIPAGVDLPQ